MFKYIIVTAQNKITHSKEKEKKFNRVETFTEQIEFI